MTLPQVTVLVNQFLPEPHAGLLLGMLFGVKTALSSTLYQDLVRTGTLHIVALSGMNITILISLVSFFFVRFIGRRPASLLTIGFILWFVWFVGPSASVIRAAIMGCMTLLAITLGRQNWAIWSWVFAVATMGVLHPAYLTDLSFQLSVMATLGLILFGKSQEQGNILTDGLRITLAAQVFTIPIILFSFHRLSLIAPISNLFIGWAVAPVTGIGLAMVIAGLVYVPLGQIIAWIVWVPLAYILLVVTAFSRIPFASIGWQ